MLPALDRPPCLVSFAGGRDSSAVLAVAPWSPEEQAEVNDELNLTGPVAQHAVLGHGLLWPRVHRLGAPHIRGRCRGWTGGGLPAGMSTSTSCVPSGAARGERGASADRLARVSGFA